MTLTGQAGALTRYVSPGQSIQAAIDASSNGDQIEVAPVTYNEAIDFKGKAVRLYSSGGPAVTTINGTGHYHVVQCVSGEGANTILEGFTITGGNANGPKYPDDQFGGGMYNLHSSPRVTNCIIRSNNAEWCGGGMYNAGSSPKVTNCIFRSNSAESGGGGMANWWWSSPTVTNCTFTTNTATAVSEAFGGAIDNAGEAHATVTNCILWGNYGGGGADDEISIRGGGSINITFSDIEGGQGQSWFGTGCIDADPAFVNVSSGDLRLTFGSPCIDAGNNSAPNLPDLDLDGRSRIVDGDLNGTAVVDMGAYEFLPPVENVTQNHGYDSIQPAIDDANDGDEIVVAPGTFNEAIDFRGKAIRLYSSGGPEVTTIRIFWSYHVVQCINGEDANTILEGFTITGGNSSLGGGMLNQGSSPTVADCIFSYNSAFVGGGMYNDNSSPTVTDCIFSYNSALLGGGMFNGNSSPTLTECTFSYNSTPDGANGADGDYEDNAAGGDGGNSGHGGGMYNDQSSPMVTDCNFTNNQTGNGGHGGDGSDGDIRVGRGGNGGHAGRGGGMCNYNSSPTVVNCTFSGNRTGNGGNGGHGRVYVGHEHPGGAAGNGGGGAGMDNSGNSSPSVSNCIFSKNITGAGGNGGNGEVTSCGRPGANGGDGAGMCNGDSSSPTVNDCTFIENQTGNGGNAGEWMEFYANSGGRGGSGAAMCNINQCSPAISNCEFTGNVTGNGGLGRFMHLYFRKGSAGGDGGDGAGICNTMDSSPNVSNCVFNGNRTGSGNKGGNGHGDEGGNGATGGRGGVGAAMCNFANSSPTVQFCTLAGNVTGNGGNGGDGAYNFGATGGDGGDGGDGGPGAGMYNDSSSPNLNDCTFIRNVTGIGGARGDPGGGLSQGSYGAWGLPGRGVMWNNVSSAATVTNCSFDNNSMDVGSSICNASSDATVTNCIVWGVASIEMWNDNSTPVVTYSDVKGGFTGTGNINADPMFVNTASGNLRLSPGSPCIDAGDNNSVPADSNDLDGRPRIIDGDCNDVAVVDMGAYEFNYAYMGDLDYNCGVDFGDFAMIGRAWLTEEGDADYDPTRNISVPADKYIDWRDLAVIAENWLSGPE